jgi:hypothetical protein
MSNTARSVFIDPSYSVYYENRLFDTKNPVLNRDGMLEPFQRLRTAFTAQHVRINTADYLQVGRMYEPASEFYSLGLLDNFRKLVGRKDVRLRGFVIMEPPVVAPKLYRALPELTRHFEQVYLHNTVGEGYSLKNVDRSKLRRFYWPQPLKDAIQPYWSKLDRLNRIVVINGNHIPRSLRNELYSKRIEAMATLAKSGVVDLYGRGWDKWWSRHSMWPPYWLNYRTLMSIYRGACESKYEVLSQYRFSLCFENMAMEGYVTEKIFDCLYAGTIPIYLGAKDIEQLIPSDAYIDCRRYGSWDEMRDRVLSLTPEEVAAMKEAGRAFLRSVVGLRYYNSLLEIFHD